MFFTIITPSGEELDANLFNVVAYASDARGRPVGEALWEGNLSEPLQAYYGGDEAEDEAQ